MPRRTASHIHRAGQLAKWRAYERTMMLKSLECESTGQQNEGGAHTAEVRHTFQQPCCVPGCHSETTEFRFPTEPMLARKWRRAIKRFNFKLGLKWKSNIHDTICSNHFREDDFERDLEGEDKRLKAGAVPSIPCGNQEVGSVESPHLGQYAKGGTDNKFSDNWTPESSARETRKLTRKIYSEGLQRNRYYDDKGILIKSGKDVCDCLDEECPGCHFPCPKCSSPKCGHECRAHRRWVYDHLEVEGYADKVIKNVNK